jgi:hypothetical protein
MRRTIAACLRERNILERALHGVADQAAKTDDLVDEAIAVGHGRSDPLVVHAKMLRMELLKVKADLERELEDFSLNCSKCGLDVPLGQRTRSHARSLVARGARAARRAGGPTPHDYDSRGCPRDSRVARRAEHGARTSRHSLSCGPVCERRSSSRARAGTASPPMSTGRTRHRLRG